MMRVWHSGFETGNSDGETEWPGPSSLASFAFETSVVHGVSARSGKFTGQGHIGTPTGLALTRAWLRLYLRIAGSPTAQIVLAGFYNASGDTWLNLSMDTSRRLLGQYNPGLTTFGPSGFQLAVDTWYRLELGLWTGGEFQLRFQGVPWAGGLLPLTTTGAIDHVRLGPSNAAPGTTLYYDDVALNDTSGDTNTSWPGVSEGMRLLVPAADVTAFHGGWAAQAGGAHYAAIDDLPASGVDETDYVKETDGGVGEDSRWSFTPCGVDGVASALLVGARWGGDGTSARLARLQLGGSSDLTVPPYTWLDGPEVSLALNGWLTTYPAVRAEAQWNGSRRMLTTQGLDQMTARVIRRSGTGEIRVAAVWATVDVALRPSAPAHQARWKPRGLLEAALP